jgi:type I restriction enzyme S subunit
VAGKYVAKEEYVEDGEFWIYGSNSIMGKLDRFLVEQSHVVMAAIGAYAGAVRYSEEPSWINNNAMALVPSDKVIAKYLHLWLESEFDLKRVVVGTGQPYVQRPLLLKEIIELPPLPEQKRIVDLISSVDSYIEALQQQLESVRSASNAQLEKIVSEFNDDWVEVTLGEVLEISRGGSPRPIQDYLTDFEEGINWVKIAEIMPFT